MSLKNKKPHMVSVNMESYRQIIIGLRKTGKTTLFRDLILRKYNKPECGLLLAFEKGYGALNNIMQEDIEDWNHFESVVDELVYDKKDMPYKIIAIDTIDEMVSMAETAALKFFNSRAGAGKKVATLNEAGGGFNRGKAYAIKLLKDTLEKLSKAGYGLFLIGHSKEKKMKTKLGEEFVQYSCNLTNDYNDIFLNSADLITFLSSERQIEDSVIKGEKIYMNFRGYEFDCGSRLKDVPDRIEYSADGYIQVFENAVKSLISETGLDIEEVKKEQYQETEKKADEAITKIKEKDLKKIIAKIKNVIKEKLTNNKITTKEVMSILDSYNVSSPDDLKLEDAIEVLQKLE